MFGRVNFPRERRRVVWGIWPGCPTPFSWPVAVPFNRRGRIPSAFCIGPGLWAATLGTRRHRQKNKHQRRVPIPGAGQSDGAVPLALSWTLPPSRKIQSQTRGVDPGGDVPRDREVPLPQGPQKSVAEIYLAIHAGSQRPQAGVVSGQSRRRRPDHSGDQRPRFRSRVLRGKTERGEIRNP